MGKTSSPPPIKHPHDTINQPTTDPYVRRFTETTLLCILDIYAVSALSRSSAVDTETRGLTQASLLCASMSAICATLLLSRSNITRGIAEPRTTDIRWQQRWMALSPAFWAVCGGVLLLPSALSHFCGTHFPPVSLTHVRAATVTVLILGITCISAILASFRGLCRSLD